MSLLIIDQLYKELKADFNKYQIGDNQVEMIKDMIYFKEHDTIGEEKVTKRFL